MSKVESVVLIVVIVVAVLGLFYLVKGVGKAGFFPNSYNADLIVNNEYLIDLAGSHHFLVQTADDNKAGVVLNYKKRVIARNVPLEEDGITVYYFGAGDAGARFKFVAQ